MILLVPECFPCVWGLPLAEHASTEGTACGVEGGTVLNNQSVRGMMTHSVKKEKLIVFMFFRNNNNGWGERVGRAEIVTWVSDRSG
jgi:hypothetical protein